MGLRRFLAGSDVMASPSLRDSRSMEGSVLELEIQFCSSVRERRPASAQHAVRTLFAPQVILIVAGKDFYLAAAYLKTRVARCSMKYRSCETKTTVPVYFMSALSRTSLARYREWWVG